MADGGNSTSLSLEAAQAKSSLSIKFIFLLNLLINCSGTLLHLGLVLVTFRNKKFQSTCHLLIAANSMATITAYLLVLSPLLLVLIPTAHIQLVPCFCLQLVPMFASFHIYSLMPAIGFDRLLSAFWAKWYMGRDEHFYLVLLLSASTTFPLFILAFAFINVLSQPNGQVLCSLGEILDGQALWVVFCCLFCILLSASCYAMVWIRLKWEARSNMPGVICSWQPIFRSLSIILCLQIGGWVVGQCTFALVYLNPDWLYSLTRWQINTLVMCFLSVSAALDVPVLYTTSSDYRTAFQKQFPWLLKFGFNKKENGAIVVVKIKSRASSITPIERPFA